MACVSSPSFSLSVNGNLHGFFRGKRGLRQGDPMSPYLFTLVMEVLTLLLEQRVADSGEFRFHNRCERHNLINLCFADDLFLFAYSDEASARVIMDSLSIFKQLSGLVPSLPKSTTFFCNVSDHMKGRICAIMPFQVGSLPVRYLGVPLVSSRLAISDCAILKERLENRITSWKNKYLSFAGRVQLIKSVLSSMHLYWASVFILPEETVGSLERLMRRFLWDSGGTGKGKAKVAWSDVCLPKEEGGLGIRRISDMNKSLVARHVWSLLSKRSSLWVDWIYAFRIRDGNFWTLPIRSGISFGWRKILQLRNDLRPHIWKKIGDGMDTSMWIDKWHSTGPLTSIISWRAIHREGFNPLTSVAEVAQRNWNWPAAWIDAAPALLECSIPSVQSGVADRMEWCNSDGHAVKFSASAVWEVVRHRGDRVLWCSLVWFPIAIPKHAFILWLVFRNKLKTHDLLRPWEVGGAVNLNLLCCVLCKRGRESHSHLFFECAFSGVVWETVKAVYGVRLPPHFGQTMIEHLLDRRRHPSCLGKLLLAATVYHCWLERNKRMFHNQARPPESVISTIMADVRIRMAQVKR